jgi:hypothetical protein
MKGTIFVSLEWQLLIVSLKGSAKLMALPFLFVNPIYSVIKIRIEKITDCYDPSAQQTS